MLSAVTGDSLGFIRLVRFIGSFLFAAESVYYSGSYQDESDCGQYDAGEAYSADCVSEAQPPKLSILFSSFIPPVLINNYVQNNFSFRKRRHTVCAQNSASSAKAPPSPSVTPLLDLS